MDFAHFIDMGGYALYVWGSYGLALVVYAGLMIHAVVKLERLRKTDADESAR